ncbi:unnamed protein product [Clonostachys chloroleuca]|uniref:Uncharacterized protein n=1 Tax=Clonostachys chloroleuca TaxID=1926264 RepID=A0AA35V9Q3_9HYPO|nr:unnamed protein product [Clonostachys chloroleuca]
MVPVPRGVTPSCAFSSSSSLPTISPMEGFKLFSAREAPTYQSGFFSLMVCFAIATAACLALRFYLVFENRRQDRAGFDDSILPSDALDINMMDKTDKEIKQFRYV